MKRILLVLAAISISSMASAELTIDGLRTNRLDSPLGIDPQSHPKVGWVLHSPERNTVQTAYELTLKSEGRKLWTSGRVESRNSTAVEIPFDLVPSTSYSWSVRVWDNHGQVSKTAFQSFSTGLRVEDWQAQWIGTSKTETETPMYFAASYPMRKSIRSATLYITSHGLYEASVNGARVGECYLTPGWTSYHSRLQYQAYDLTQMLRKGNNDFEVLVTPGWFCGGINYGKPENRYRYAQDLLLLAQVNVVYSDGTTETWSTGPDWRMSLGEVTFANIYDGQTIDHNAGREWTEVMVADLAKNNLVATQSPSVCKHNPLRPIQSFVSPKGEKILDFGQNMTGWERIRVRGSKGDTVRVFHAEILDNDGNFYTSNLRTAKATSTYILSGDGVETFEPTHTFYGFRYIKVEGVEGELNMEDFEAFPVYSGFRTIGHFRSSNDLVNQLQSNIEWGFHSNFVDVPTDCPQRDERLGWTGDAQVFFRTASFLGDVDRFFVKWMQDLAVDQRSDGGVPRTIPDTHRTTKDGKEDRNRVGAVGWADCATIIPWNHFMAYGDVTILENQYESMRRWVDFVIGESEKNGYLWKCGRRHYGDWLFWSVNNDCSGESAVTSKSLLGQCFFAGSLANLISAAKVLGREDDAVTYGRIREKVVDAFLREYVTPSGLVSSDTQTAYVLALHFGLLPDAMRPQAVDRLVANIRHYRYHITTGFLGTPYICNVLTDNGRSDIAYRLLLQETCPGWLYPVTKGATTIWERWDSILPDGRIPENGMNSFNHYSYGAIGDWLYRSAVGIRESSPGYESIVIRPHVGGGFSFMQASTITPYGEVEAAWSAEKDVLRTLDVTIPVNTTAEVFVPAYSAQAVSSDIDVEGSFENGYVRYSLGSGRYRFNVK